MEAISTLVRVSLPNYLSNLPIPETVGGWFSLGVGDWVRLIPFGAAVGGLSYLSLKGLAAAPGVGPAIQVGFANEITQVSLLVATYISSFRLLDQEHLSKVPGFKPTHVNNKIKKDAPKVVDTIDMEDLGDKVKAIFCLLKLKHYHSGGTYYYVQNYIVFFSPLRPGRVLPVLEEQEVPLLRRFSQQAQRDHGRQRGAAYRQEVLLGLCQVPVSSGRCFCRSSYVLFSIIIDTAQTIYAN